MWDGVCVLMCGVYVMVYVFDDMCGVCDGVCVCMCVWFVCLCDSLCLCVMTYLFDVCVMLCVHVCVVCVPVR